ncbi:MAG: CHAD domain-containing protein, partial [Acidobacteriota bacterium]|nr:CHAD domain-containing protein [Acidobacteriota bacterium]
LEDGLEGLRVPRVAIERVRAHVVAERERRRAKMLAQLERVDLSEALARVERVAKAASPRVTSYSTEAMSRRVRARAIVLGRGLDRAGTLYHPEHLHAVRIAGKKLRYALEVVTASGAADVAADLRTLKKAQERLGLLHDYQILLEHVAAVADATPPGAPGAAGLKTLAGAYDRECRKLHAGYMKMAPALGVIAARLQDPRLLKRAR